MLRKIRIAVALIVFVAINLFFLNVTGWMPECFGWLEKIQFIPALLAFNFFIVALWVILTLVFGRMYCSVICPLGVFQDVVAWFSRRGTRKRKNRYSYSPARNILRCIVLTLFVISLLLGIAVLPALIEPYGAYGKIVSNLFAPLYDWGNNLLSAISYSLGGYGFIPVDVVLRSGAVLIVSLLIFFVISYMAWKWGRIYCNTICPVGSFLGLLSKYSIFKIRIDLSKCKHCLLCGKQCKASCIDSKNVHIDYSRCVVCFDCIDNCEFGAISYALRRKKSETGNSVEKETNNEQVDSSRRQFMATVVATAVVTPLMSAKVQADRVVASMEGYTEPERTPIVPPGSLSIKHFSDHCVACHLCISRCPNKVLKAAWNEYGLDGFMQPVMSYDLGYCRPECTTCSDVCPTGSILKITSEAKKNIKIGYAVYLKNNCLLTQGKQCGNCVSRCPQNALTMITINSKSQVNVDVDKCIGCGACEFYCPATPFKAIYVKGYVEHVNINE